MSTGELIHDLYAPELLSDPRALAYRISQASPVHFAPQGRGYFVSRWADVSAILRDPSLQSAVATGLLDARPAAEREALAPLRETMSLWMGRTLDDHTRVRRLLQRYFTPERVRMLEPLVRSITDELLDAAEVTGELELVEGLAYPLPARVIAALLGVPASDDVMIRRWSAAITSVFRLADFEALLDSQRSIGEMSAYMAELVEARRSDPREDIISVLVAAEQDAEISTAEIVANCVLLLFAGHETTANLIANATVALLEHPEQLALVRADPALLPNMIEEVLRWDGPTKVITRMNGDSARIIAGVEIPAHALMYMGLACANLDPAEFDDPLRFDVTRANPRSLTFGLGPKFCLGAALSRVEARVAFERLLARYPTLVMRGQPQWRVGTMITRRLSHLLLAPGD